MNRNRQPEGIPAGGQWATGSKSESSVELDPVSSMVDRLREAGLAAENINTGGDVMAATVTTPDLTIEVLDEGDEFVVVYRTEGDDPTVETFDSPEGAVARAGELVSQKPTGWHVTPEDADVEWLRGDSISATIATERALVSHSADYDLPHVRTTYQWTVEDDDNLRELASGVEKHQGAARAAAEKALRQHEQARKLQTTQTSTHPEIVARWGTDEPGWMDVPDDVAERVSEELPRDASGRTTTPGGVPDFKDQTITPDACRVEISRAMRPTIVVDLPDHKTTVRVTSSDTVFSGEDDRVSDDDKAALKRWLTPYAAQVDVVADVIRRHGWLDPHEHTRLSQP